MSDPSDEARLRVLKSTGLLDSPPEPAFDRLTRLASGLIHAPVALVSLVDDRRQFFKSALGLKEPWASRRETPLTHSFCKLAVHERLPLIVSDAREHPVLRDNLAIRDLGVIAYAGIPLVVAGEAVGAFCVIDDVRRTWTDEELLLLRDLAEAVVSEIDLRLTMRKLAEQRALLTSALGNIEEAVVLLNAERRTLVANPALARLFNLPEHELDGLTRERFLENLLPQVDDPEAVRARILAASGGPEDYVLTRPRRRVLRRTEAAVKLPTGDAALVTWRDVTAEHDLLAERERQLLVDPLTGIANRRAAEAALAVEDARRRRGGSALSVAMFDVDHFKNVNDLHGHAVGDEVLRRIAITLVGRARVTDVLARWGGEEFLAVLPGQLEGALAFAERARAAVEQLRVHDLAISISAGVAELAQDESPEAAVARADVHLYEAKRSGRNRVVG